VWFGKLAVAAIFLVFVSAGCLTLERSGLVGDGPDHWTADWRTALFSDRPDKQHSKIAAILIGDETLANYPYQTPIDRSLIAQIVRSADAAGARVIGLDFVFIRKTVPEQDEALLQAIRDAHAQVVLGTAEAEGLNARQRAFRDDFLKKAGRPVGHVLFANQPENLSFADHVVRFLPDDLKESFAWTIAKAYGEVREPVSRHIAWLLPPRDGASTFPVIPAEALIGRPPLRVLRDRIVLIGADFADRDQHLTPLSVGSGKRFLGVLIQAQIITQLVDGRALFTLGSVGEFGLLLALTAIGFWLGRTSEFFDSDFVVGLIGTGVLVTVGFVAFWKYRLVLPFSSALLAWGIGIAVGHYSDVLFKWLGLSE
jgi:adenylate cyclase